MAKLPHSRQVDRALRMINAELKVALKQINQQAGRLLSKGRYDEAEQLVAAAKRIGEFSAEFDQLRRRWKPLTKLDQGSGEAKSPLWEYYQPIVHALTKAGGEADRPAIEQELEGIVRTRLKPGDLRKNARGVPRWRLMLRRARRPMIQEGLLEPSTGRIWRLTEKALSGAAGRQ